MRKARVSGATLLMMMVLLTGFMLAGCAGLVPKRTAAPASEPDETDLKVAADLFLNGKMSEAKEDWGDAVVSYMEAFKYDPKSDEIAFAITKVLIRNGKLKLALEYAHAAARLNEKNPEYWQIVQFLEEREGNFAVAADALKHYMALTPDYELMHDIKLAQYYFAMEQEKAAKNLLLKKAGDDHTSASDIFEIAKILAFNEYEADAVKVLKNLIDRDPLNVEAWLYLGQIYSETGDSEKAFATYQEALKKNPDHLTVIVTIGNQCLEENDWNNAIIYFEQAARAGEDKAKEAGIEYLDIRKTLAAVYFYSGRDADAKAIVDSLISVGKDDTRLYFSLGKAMNFLERYNEAIGYYRTAFKQGVAGIQKEYVVRAYSGYAAALVKTGQGTEALRVIREDSASQINDATISKELEAGIYMELERYADAISIYEWLSASDPEENGYLFNLSLACDLGGKFQDAEKALLSILDKEPDNALALNNLSYMYLEHDMNFNKALDMVKQALINDPHNGAYLDTLAWAYYKLNKYKDARKHVNRALKWAGSDDIGVIYEHQGDILAKLGDTTGAAAAYRKAIDSGEDKARIQPKLDSTGK
jgi:tetratricopeptide (TPR) repeat protein